MCLHVAGMQSAAVSLWRESSSAARRGEETSTSSSVACDLLSPPANMAGHVASTTIPHNNDRPRASF